MKKILGLSITSAMLFSCGVVLDKNPHVVDTPQGEVVCLLYSLNTSIWDQAAARPSTMTDAEADEVCIAEGRRLAELQDQ